MPSRMIVLVIAIFAVSTRSGCAFVQSPVNGGIYTNVKWGVGATSNDAGSKTGSATATSILGLIATGDASIDAAMKDGDITKVHHVDVTGMSILGVYAEFTTTVYGE